MGTKKVCYTELAYVFGIIALAWGTACMERADFGMSMVVAPAYLLHLKISQYFPVFSFGMAEYFFQAVVLILMCIILRQVKVRYFFSFVTALLYGFALDLCLYIVGYIPGEGVLWRIVFFFGGMIICTMGVAFLFRTYIAPEAYELFVKEIAGKTGVGITKVKTIYDCCSCGLGILFSFLFFGFGRFEGVKWGTVFCAFVNGWMIGQIGVVLDRCLIFKDAFSRRY